MRNLIFGLIGLCSATTVCWSAQADVQRLALVVGNSAYEVGELENPVRDARLMEDALSDVGFDVTILTDATERDLGRALVDFRNRLKLAEGGAVAVFYYAGHAVQANGENFLIPIDAEIEDEIDLDIHGVPLATVMSTLQRSGAELKLVFLDACRNNPYAASTRSGTRGLAPIEDASGTLISYATRPGDVAVDGTGNNSPYTRSLARHIRQPGLLISQVLTRVRADVMERTAGRQEPWQEGALGGDFYFIEPEVPATVADAGGNDDNSDDAPRPGEASTIEVMYWQSIADSDNPAMFQAYLEDFPEGRFKRLAQIRLRELTAGGQGEQVATNDLPETTDASSSLRTMEETIDTANIDSQASDEATLNKSGGRPQVAAIAPPETSFDAGNTKSSGPVQGATRTSATPELTVIDTSRRAFAQRSVTLRAGPGNEFDHLGDIPPGHEVHITGYVDQSDWVRISRTDGGTAFAMRDFLGPEPPHGASAGRVGKFARQN